MSLEIHPTADPRRLRVVGEVDLHTAPVLAEKLDAVVDAPGDVRLDLAEMTFIDSSGIRVLLSAFRKLRRHDARLILAGSRSVVRELFELLGLPASGIVLADGDDADG